MHAITKLYSYCISPSLEPQRAVSWLLSSYYAVVFLKQEANHQGLLSHFNIRPKNAKHGDTIYPRLFVVVDLAPSFL